MFHVWKIESVLFKDSCACMLYCTLLLIVCKFTQTKELIPTKKWKTKLKNDLNGLLVFLCISTSEAARLTGKLTNTNHSILLVFHTQLQY